MLLSHELEQILNLLKQLNPLRYDLQKLLLLDVFELHELLQRLQELLRRMYAVRTWAHGVPKAIECAGLIVGVPNPS